jgi:transposase
VLTDGGGVPLALVVAGANAHDKTLVSRTLNNLMAPRPAPSGTLQQNLCADKGYDYADVRALVDKWGYTAHIPVRGTNPQDRPRVPGYRSRRWVVERTHSWFNRFRRLLVRWEKKAANYIALLHLACAQITLRAAGVMG